MSGINWVLVPSQSTWTKMKIWQSYSSNYPHPETPYRHDGTGRFEWDHYKETNLTPTVMVRASTVSTPYTCQL